MKKLNLKQNFAGLFAVLTIFGATTLTAIAQDNNVKTENLISNDTNRIRCGEHTLRGSYGTNISGTFFLSPTMPIPIASVGRLVFDGVGNVSGTDSNSFGGTFSRSAVTGTYTVEGDCTGTLTVTFPNGFVITNDIVIVDSGKEVSLIQTNPGAVVTGVLKRQ